MLPTSGWWRPVEAKYPPSTANTSPATAISTPTMVPISGRLVTTG